MVEQQLLSVKSLGKVSHVARARNERHTSRRRELSSKAHKAIFNVPSTALSFSINRSTSPLISIAGVVCLDSDRD